MNERVLGVVLVAGGWATGCTTSASVEHAVTRIDAEPAGGNCAHGGSAIRTGIDRDDDGALDDSEIERTDYICDTPSELWAGDFTSADWMDPARVNALMAARFVLGSLSIVADRPISLPALEGVSGNLSIVGGEIDVALPGLRRVGGAATIRTSGARAPVLPVLDRIAGDLSLGGSGGLRGLIDAPGLHTLGGSLVIESSASSEVTLPGLQAIAGSLVVDGALHGLHLDGLASVAGRIDLTPRASLPLALPALQSLEGDLQSIGGEITAIDLPQLAQLGGMVRFDQTLALVEIKLPQLRRVRDNFIVSNVPLLTTMELGMETLEGIFDLQGAPKLVSMPLSLRQISGLDFLITATGLVSLDFAQLTSSAAPIRMFHNRTLESVTLPVLTTGAGLTIDNSPQLTTVAAADAQRFESLILMELGALQMLDFPRLRSLSFLELSAVPLADLSGFGALTEAGIIAIDGASQLKDFRGLTSLGWIGSLQLRANPALISFAGLDQVTAIEAQFDVQDLPALTSLAGLQNVSSIGGYVRFSGNAALADLALPGLLSLNGTLWILDMESLDSLSGLDSLTALHGDIHIENNRLLTPEEIDAFRQRF